MLTTRREMARMRRALAKAEARTAELEAKLEAERDVNRRRETELLDRVLTAAGRYGLSPEAHQTASSRPAQPSPRTLSALDEARLAAYIQAAKQAGKTEHDARRLFEMELRGEVFTPPYLQAEGTY